MHKLTQAQYKVLYLVCQGRKLYKSTKLNKFGIETFGRLDRVSFNQVVYQNLEELKLIGEAYIVSGAIVYYAVSDAGIVAMAEYLQKELNKLKKS